MPDYQLPATNVTASRVGDDDGTIQYMRKASLLIGVDGGDALDLSELRFTFDIKRGDSQTPNSAKISVYNIARSTAARAQKEFKRVIIQAGYNGNYGIIFDGTVKQSWFRRVNRTDTCLEIRAADGDSAYNFAIVNTTLAAGSTAADQVDVCAKAMAAHGVTKGYTAGLDSPALPRGVVMFGMARDFMQNVAHTTQTCWSIQDGKIITIPETSYMPGDIPVIGPDTGLIGMPVQAQHGINFRTLLNPNVKIGTLVQLDTSAIQRYEQSLALGDQGDMYVASFENKLQADGYYYVMSANHHGDTRGNDWYTDVVCLTADPTFISKGYADKLQSLDQSAINPYF